jgi:hypothetical protein
MSVSSSKSTVMSAIAYLDTERTMRLCGMPSIASSIGIVIRCSISSGVMPGAFRITFTWVGETSGKASIGSVRQACAPPTISAIVASATNSGWPSDRFTSRAIMAAPRWPRP